MVCKPTKPEALLSLFRIALIVLAVVSSWMHGYGMGAEDAHRNIQRALEQETQRLRQQHEDEQDKIRIEIQPVPKKYA